jgi:ribosomal protein S27AE
MSAQPCPNCDRRGFTWAMDEEDSQLTRWSCSICRYVAFEDEAKQVVCPSCHAPGAMTLRDARVSEALPTFVFCVRCRSRLP